MDDGVHDRLLGGLKPDDDLNVEMDQRPSLPGEYGHPIPRELFLREMGMMSSGGRMSRLSMGLQKTLNTAGDYALTSKELHREVSTFNYYFIITV
jgi:hypothetical protein